MLIERLLGTGEGPESPRGPARRGAAAARAWHRPGVGGAGGAAGPRRRPRVDARHAVGRPGAGPVPLWGQPEGLPARGQAGAVARAGGPAGDTAALGSGGRRRGVRRSGRRPRRRRPPRAGSSVARAGDGYSGADGAWRGCRVRGCRGCRRRHRRGRSGCAIAPLGSDSRRRLARRAHHRRASPALVGWTLDSVFGLRVALGGPLEGLCLGGAVAAGYAATTSLREGGIAAPSGRARWRTAAPCAAAAGAMADRAVPDGRPARRRHHQCGRPGLGGLAGGSHPARRLAWRTGVRPPHANPGRRRRRHAVRLRAGLGPDPPAWPGVTRLCHAIRLRSSDRSPISLDPDRSPSTVEKSRSRI